MEALKVTKIGFDSLENREPEYIIEQKIFTHSSDKNFMIKAGEYITSNECKLYMGYNRQVYPRYEIQEIKLE
jgi:hypothetical protein